MGYLTPADYKVSIQADNLNQVIGSDPTILQTAEQRAVEKASTLLVQKYVINREFAPTNKWDKTKTYNAFTRVYIDADAWVSATSYALGIYVTYTPAGAKTPNVYKSIVNNTTTGTFTPAEWQLIGYQYAIYSAPAPQAEFDYKAMYKVGDKVFWNNKVYTCNIASINISQEFAIQYYTYAQVPFGNIFPDDPINGMQYWGAGVTYTVPPTTDITDTTYWNAGDNRSQLVVWAVVSFTLYYVHSRIAPRNIPELRVKDYDDAIVMLRKDFAGGEATAINLVPIQPRTGGRVRYGGNVKNNNTY
jgi:hypothetical protein